MNRVKLMTGVAAYLLVIGIYAAFFAYPVEPAVAKASEYHEEESEVYSTLPYVVYKVYVRSSITPGILLVATVRTPFVPDSTYSKILRSMEGIIENETKERYNADIDLALVGEKNAIIMNRTVVMDNYDVHLKYLNPYSQWGRPDTIKLYFGAFFCREKYESVIVAYVSPPIFQDDFSSVMAGVSC